MALEQGIQNFYSAAQDTGFTRDFQLRITEWKVLNNAEQLDEIDALVMLRTATLPSMVTTVNQVPFMGLDFNLPGTTKFPGSQAWNVEFYYQQNLREAGYSYPSLRELFISTMLGNFDFQETSTGNLQLPNKDDHFIELAVVDDYLNDIPHPSLITYFLIINSAVFLSISSESGSSKITLYFCTSYCFASSAGV